MTANDTLSHPRPPKRPWRSGPVTLSELMSGLVWPLLMRAPALALQPQRLVLGMLTILVLWGFGKLIDQALGAAGSEPIASSLVWSIRDGWIEAGREFVSLDFERSLETFHNSTFGEIMRLMELRPMTLLGVLVLLAPIWAIGGGAIARSVALDVAAGINSGVRDSLRFSFWKWRSLSSALLLPLGLTVLMVGLLKVCGWLFLGLPGLNVLGAIGYGIFLLIGLIVVVLMVGLVLGHGLLAPAAAVEGSDAVDAVQRVYAYLIGRPGRALAYLAIALIQGLIVVGVLGWLFDSASTMTSEMASSWVPRERWRPLFEPGYQTGVSGNAIAFWQLALTILLSGILVSWCFSAGTLVYLLLRRVCDEQDVRELWMPGMIPGTAATERPALTAAESSSGSDLE